MLVDDSSQDSPRKQHTVHRPAFYFDRRMLVSRDEGGIVERTMAKRRDDYKILRIKSATAVVGSKTLVLTLYVGRFIQIDPCLSGVQSTWHNMASRSSFFVSPLRTITDRAKTYRGYLLCVAQ